MPDLMNRTVFALSGRQNAAASYADPRGKPYDVAIAGQFFLRADSQETPFVRQTSPVRKEQQDTEKEPGEQSLAGWWLRSQESFHKGAGVLYQEDRVENAPSERFRTSMGVDVWTPGQVKLLPDMIQHNTGNTGCSILAQGMDGTTPVFFMADGATLHRYYDMGSPALGVTDLTWGGVGTITSLEVWDGYYYVTDSTGVYRGPVNNTASGTKLWNFATPPTTVFYRRQAGYALLLVDGKAYDVTDESVSPTLPAPFFTMKDSVWKWTAVTHGPGDIRAAGHSNGQGAIWRFAPKLSATGWDFQQATGLPRGEIISGLANYYNTYLVLATNRGVRFAAFEENGQYTFGPRTWEAPEGAAARAVHVYDRWVYVAVNKGLADGTSGLVRIDPEAEISEGRFAWANDLQPTLSGATIVESPVGVCDVGGRLVIAYPSGMSVASTDRLVASGYLTTGRIRFRMLEPKLFKYLKVHTDAIPGGSISISAVTDQDSLAAVATYSTVGSIDHGEASLPQSLGPIQSLAIKFTLTRAGNFASNDYLAPVLRSYQIKAVPAPKRQRIFRVPVMIYDKEEAANGSYLGRTGYGLERIQALEAAEESGDFVLFQDFRTGETRLCQIDEIDARSTAVPKEGWGGTAYITLRSAD